MVVRGGKIGDLVWRHSDRPHCWILIRGLRGEERARAVALPGLAQCVQ